MGKNCQWYGCGEEVEQREATKHVDGHTRTDSNMAVDFKCYWSTCKCKTVFTTQYNLLVHFKNHFLVKEFVCEECFNNFAKEDSLIKHKQKHDEENEKVVRCADKVFIADENRSNGLDRTKELLSERTYYSNLSKILKHEICRDKSKDDSWNDYL